MARLAGRAQLFQPEQLPGSHIIRALYLLVVVSNGLGWY